MRVEAGTGLIPSLLIHLTRTRSIPRDPSPKDFQ